MESDSKIRRFLFKLSHHWEYLRMKKVVDRYSVSLSDLSAFDLSSEFIQEADVIYIHWVNMAFLSIKDVKKLLDLNKLVVCYMHDMWPITGICHYSFDCNQYMSRCVNCNQIKSSNYATKIFDLKKKLLGGNSNLIFYTPSSWLKSCVNKSAIFGENKSFVLPNPVNTNIYKPQNKAFAKNFFGLNNDKKHILFLAFGGSENVYKGWGYLEKALNLLDCNKDYELVLVGNKVENIKLPFKLHSIGYLTDDIALSLLYNAVDIFVTPSMADNYPNVILESLACATPVVGFDIGGIPDLVKTGKTGYLAKYKDSADLARGIEYVLDTGCQISDLTIQEIQNRNSYQSIATLHLTKLEHFFN